MEKNKVERLGIIINVREDQKKKTTRELMQVNQEKVAETKKLDALEEEQQGAIQQAMRHRRVKANNTQIASSFIKKLSKEIQNQKNHIEQLEAKENTKREELIERVKAKNVVEKLQDRFIEENRKLNDSNEQKLTDSLNQRSKIE